MWIESCRSVQAYLPLLAGDELVGSDRRRVERHLIGCPSCRHRLTSLRGALGALRAAAARPAVSPEAPSLWPALARQIRESRRPQATWGLAWPSVATWAAAGLCAGLLGLAWTLGSAAVPPAAEAIASLSREGPSVQPPPVVPAPKASTRRPPPPDRLAERRPPAPRSAPAPLESGSPTPRGFDLDRNPAVSPEARDSQPTYSY